MSLNFYSLLIELEEAGIYLYVRSGQVRIFFLKPKKEYPKELLLKLFKLKKYEEKLKRYLLAARSLVDENSS